MVAHICNFRDVTFSWFASFFSQSLKFLNLCLDTVRVLPVVAIFRPNATAQVLLVSNAM